MVTVDYDHILPYRRLCGMGDPGPYCRVRLWNETQSVETLCLVDSGADYSVFDWETGLSIGLVPDEEHREDLQIASGFVQGYRFHIVMETCGIRFGAAVLFVPDWPFDCPLLGRSDFFGAFHVGFEHFNSRVLLRAWPADVLPGS